MITVDVTYAVYIIGLLTCTCIVGSILYLEADGKYVSFNMTMLAFTVGIALLVGFYSGQTYHPICK